MNEINSHIQMPRFLLKKFEGDNHRIYYYDVIKRIIGNNGHARSLNTEEGYYSSAFEDKMRDEIETPFSRIVNSVISLFAVSDKEDWEKINKPIFTEDDKLICRQFFYLLLAREPGVLQAFLEKSVYSVAFTKTQNDDMAVGFSMDALCKIDSLKDYKVAVCLNHTETPYILSNFGVVSYIGNGLLHYTLPVSPKVAITLYYLHDDNSYYSSMIPNLFSFRKTEQIDFFNLQSIKQQINLGWGYICSNDIELLKSYISIVNENNAKKQ